jgi:hypothetical protein
MTLPERMCCGEQAIATAKVEGRDVLEWESHLALLKQQAVDDAVCTNDTITDNAVIAVLFDWAMAGSFWLALRDDFKSGDDYPVFFASELPHLRLMTPDELRRPYAENKALGGGWIRD